MIERYLTHCQKIIGQVTQALFTMCWKKNSLKNTLRLKIVSSICVVLQSMNTSVTSMLINSGVEPENIMLDDFGG
jgi:Na+-transporting NADH:ubiquinone oxidoreductase subunit NqrF